MSNLRNRESARTPALTALQSKVSLDLAVATSPSPKALRFRGSKPSFDEATKALFAEASQENGCHRLVGRANCRH
jgi:hypothetical protein